MIYEILHIGHGKYVFDDNGMVAAEIALSKNVLGKWIKDDPKAGKPPIVPANVTKVWNDAKLMSQGTQVGLTLVGE